MGVCRHECPNLRFWGTILDAGQVEFIRDQATDVR
jgi:hypothetical protein